MRYAAVAGACVEAGLHRVRASLARAPRLRQPPGKLVRLVGGTSSEHAHHVDGVRRLGAALALSLLVAAAIGGTSVLTTPHTRGDTPPSAPPRLVIEGLAGGGAGWPAPTPDAWTASPDAASPDAGAPDAAAPPYLIAASGAASLLRDYVVKPGDTLSTIARGFHLSFMTLVWANTLTDPTALHVGQHLVIPPVDGLLYTARPGDTLDALSRTYGISGQAILGASHVVNPVLTVGELLVLPGVQGAALPTAAPTPRPAATAHRTAAPVRRTAPATAAPATAAPATGGRGASRSYNSFSPGYCTWGAAYMFHTVAGVYPGWNGNAWQWGANAARAGWRVVSTPSLRSIVVFPPWVQGAGGLGHVGWVTSINSANRTLVIREMNGTAGWNRWDTRTIRFDSRLRFILA